jgi:hypothetical protein
MKGSTVYDVVIMEYQLIFDILKEHPWVAHVQ